jgi:hypothetical protein
VRFLQYLRDTEETHWSQQAKKDLQLARRADRKDLQPNVKEARRVQSKQTGAAVDSSPPLRRAG